MTKYYRNGGLGKPKVITTYVYPPIPVRTSDWSAHYDGEEEGHVGWGSTEAEAVADLVEKASA